MAVATFTGGATALVAKRLRAKEEARESSQNQMKGEFIMTKSTLTRTKPSRRRVALIEEYEGLEMAAILASPSPLAVTPMGAFPLSLIALGQIRRRHFDDTLTLRPKKARNATEELESPREIEIAALTKQIGTTERGARPYPPPIMKHGASEHLISPRLPCSTPK